MKFWDTTKKEFSKTVLIIPNWTWFGKNKDINSDSFLLVMKSFLENNRGADNCKWIIPYPTENLPTSLSNFDNVELVDLGKLSTFAPMMKTQFPSNFFKNIFGQKIDIIWSHLPEWTNQTLIARRWNVMTQPVYGYCHWWETKENGAYKWNSFVANINGILQMKECGVNSKWVKNLIIERAGEYFSQKQLDKLEEIIQPWYLGSDKHRDNTEKNDIPTIVFNHRNNGWTGYQYFFDLMDKFHQKGYKFKVYTTTADIDKPYVEYVGNPNREEYLKNISKAHIGVGAFKDYSAWSMSVTDGLSVGIPYMLPKGLCYEEMVGDDYPLLYNDRVELESWIEKFLDDGTAPMIDTKPIVDKLMWSNSLTNWTISKIIDEKR